jgi:hypothetical protein
MLLFLLACATVGYTERTMRDPMPGAAPGEFYVVISERQCLPTTTGGAPFCADAKARLLRCVETSPGVPECHTALTSDQAFAAAEHDAKSAGPLTCADVIAALRQNATEADLLTIIRSRPIARSEVECIESQGVPASVRAEVERRAK